MQLKIGKGMLATFCLEVYISFFKTKKPKIIQFEISRRFKKTRCYSLEHSKKVDERCRQEDLKEELLRPVVIDKKREI